MSEETTARVQEAVKKFSFTATHTAKGIHVYNKKGALAATVIDGNVKQMKRGSQNLCGALVRDAIKAVL